MKNTNSESQLPGRNRIALRRFIRWLVAAALLGCATALALHSAKFKARAGFTQSDFTVPQKSSDGVWSTVDETSFRSQSLPNRGLRSFQPIELSTGALARILSEAPMESSADARARRTLLTLPAPDGSFSRFSIVESPILAPELAARYPEIRTYMAQGLDQPTATSRFDWTPTGFHGIVLSPMGTILIEPAGVGNVENYIVYSQSDVIVNSGECDVTEQEQEAAIARNPIVNSSSGITPAVTSGTALRTYRLAAAATAEYTQAYGSGTVSGGLQAITTTINLVDAIYEREVAIRMTLVANEDSIIFTDTTTDGYTSDNASAMFNENQGRLDTIIGPANYDVGHVFDGRIQSGGFSWQGIGDIGSVCITGRKARGVDIFRSIGPSVLYAFYSAAHEFGHQFSATHTFNANTGLCNSGRTSSTAYEPSSGSTIMAYRLACNPDDLNSMDTYFHNNSIEQIVNFTTGGTGNSCANMSSTGNNPPVVNAGPAFTIPMGTPFTLTATGSDSDGDALTFGWEEFDLGTVAPPDTDDGSRPIFRSFLPTTSPSRIFPRLPDVLSGTTTIGESMPTTTRTMNFRVTARDNRAGGGGVNSAATQVNVRNDSGPFTVTQPASATTWPASSNQTVTWNIANTNLAPVSCANVRITLSTDGGTTFPIILANSTPNDGSETITIPGTPSGNARVRVEAAGNIFFNISRALTISGSTNTLPTISGFSPGSGAVGTSVIISGFNFISPTSVAFNGTNATFTVNSTTEIVATVPVGASTGPITVITPSGTATSALQFGVPITNNAIQFANSAYQITEGTDADAIVTINRAGDTSNPATIDYTTSDTAGINCNTPNTGAASSRCDYLATIGTLRFAANETAKNIVIPIVDDSYLEGTETFRITLSNPTGNGASLGSPAIATITINDNDSTTTANPIEVASFFVRQHYIDFLNREPDPSGLAFWTNNITSCGSNQPCIDVKRVDTSAAFFLSIEFQDTGYLVYRIYKAAYGNISGAPVPVRLNEFLPDTQEIGNGVIVNQGNWQQQLEANKQALALEFVQRARFTAAYSTSLTPQQFVNLLFANAAVSQQGPEYVAAINEFGGANTTADVAARSRALRDVAEHPALIQQEFNRAFVLMQYYGYLRRNPYDPPELTLDYQGYNFWLAKLNTFGGNYVNAEMVKAFITSDEYRHRFGP